MPSEKMDLDGGVMTSHRSQYDPSPSPWRLSGPGDPSTSGALSSDCRERVRDRPRPPVSKSSKPKDGDEPFLRSGLRAASLRAGTVCGMFLGETWGELVEREGGGIVQSLRASGTRAATQRLLTLLKISSHCWIAKNQFIEIEHKRKIM